MSECRCGDPDCIWLELMPTRAEHGQWMAAFDDWLAWNTPPPYPAFWRFQASERARFSKRVAELLDARRI